MYRFQSFHPITKTVFFAVIFAITMFSENPVVRVTSLVGAVCALAAAGLSSKKLLKLIGGGAIAIAIMGPVNCIISHQGQTVLFKVFSSSITAEAFFYGLSAGVMITGTAFWCVFITDAMDTDDIVFTLGRILPGIASVITVTLRYIPEIIKKYRETFTAQKMIGVFEGKKFFERAAIASKVFMSVTERSVEGAMDTAAVMRARGYGLRKRISARQKKWRECDTRTVTVALICAGFIAAGEITGDLGFSYYPTTGFVRMGLLGLPMILASALFFMMPAAELIDGRIKWQKSFRYRG
ncbi:MAG: hypothetical protein J6112_05840 [Clostridia bacterium]|nr:hypothetical protein [Clostridia bacterium]